jgi:site-specific DNA-methyltransferase (adenine-specific)
VLKYGTGGINVDGCRVETVDNLNGGAYSENKTEDGEWGKMHKFTGKEFTPPSGRFPANLIHDGSDEVVALFPNSKSGAMTKSYEYQNNGFSMGAPTGSTKHLCEASEGSAARFFYAAKASPAERNEGCDGLEEKSTTYMATANGSGSPSMLIDDNGNERDKFTASKKNFHPTVKPISLMKYLVKLVTPPGGTVYDPFTGSGSTLIAAKHLGFNYIGSEIQADYVQIAEARLASIKNDQLSLF